jgi:hypothetical protein
MTLQRYSQLDPRRELEQAVTLDLKGALEKRGATVTHHGTAASHAPSSAPADITIEWGGKDSHYILVEVAQRRDESEFGALHAHLEAAIRGRVGDVNLIYAGTSTSARMVRLIRNENRRRNDNGIDGRIIFLPLDELQEMLQYWATYPKEQYPLDGFQQLFKRWDDFADDFLAVKIWQEVLFPSWSAKADEAQDRLERGFVVRQESGLDPESCSS